MGFFSGLNAEKYDRKYTDRELVRRIVTYFRDFYLKIAWIAFWLLIIAGSGVLLPIVVSKSLDSLAGNITVRGMVGLALLVLLFGVVQWLANLIRAWSLEIKEMLGGMGINAIESLRSNRDHLRGVGLNQVELDALGVKAAGIA